MTGKELLEGMSFVDDEIIQDSECRRTRRRVPMGLISMAACLCIVAGSVFAWSKLSQNSFGNMTEEASGIETAGMDLAGADAAGEPDNAEFPETDPLQEVPFAVHYVKTDAKRTQTEAPEISVVQSRDELDEYNQTYRDSYNLECNDSETGFLDVCQLYDDVFFAEKDLLIILPDQTIGISGYEIQSLHPGADGGWSIDGSILTDEAHPDDAYQWHILLEIPKGLIADEGKIELNLEK